MKRTFGPSKGNRKPAQAAPGSSGNTRPTPQKGGGGSKGTAGSTEATVRNTPIVTVSSTGEVTTSGYGSKQAARRARKAQEARTRRVKAILHTKPPKPYTPSERLTSYKPPKPLSSKPPKFEGHKTAGTPTLGELKAAQSAGTLKPNKAGFLTTPKVRVVSRRLKKAKVAAHKSAGPLPGLGPEETRIARKVLKVGAKTGATRKEKLAAIETGLQETGFKNLKPYENSFGENTAGWREELAPYYTGRLNVKKSAREFFKETKTDPSIPGGGGETPGELAQTVQGSAFGGEETYGTHAAQAHEILHAFNHGGSPKALKRLREAKAEAKALGLKGKGKEVGPPPKKVVSRFKAIKAYAHELTKEHVPYVWGGGHGAFEASPSGLDCSGAVSWVLHKAGVLSSPVTSRDMGSVLRPGPGAVTVFYNSTHTFMRIGNEYWGTSVGDSGAGGLGPHPTPSASYLAQYNVAHVPGLGKKQALQLGISPVTPTSFPGMTLSTSGTTATIEQGAGVIQSKPGFTSKPIRLTPRQKVARAEAKLEALSSPKRTEATSSVTLKDLESKYGKAAA